MNISKSLFVVFFSSIFVMFLYLYAYDTITVLPFYIIMFIIILIISRIGLNIAGFSWALICIFTASNLASGASAAFSKFNHGIAQSTKDVFTFSELIVKNPPFPEFGDIFVNSPLSLFIWQKIYNLIYYLGWEFNTAYISQFNVVLVSLGLSVFFSVSASNENHLKRQVFFSCFCGVLLLFASIAIRDAFILCVFCMLFSYCFKYQNYKCKLFVFLSITILLMTLSFYIRYESVFLIFLFTVITFVIKSYKSITNFTNKVFFIIISCIVIFVILYLSFPLLYESISVNNESYTVLSNTVSSNNSLGTDLVVNQPIYIRLFLASPLLIVNPIPLWSGMFIGSEYLILKSLFGIFMVVTFPVFATSVILMFKGDLIRQNLFLTFSILSFLVTLFSIAVTSIEFRHLGPVIPLYIYVVSYFYGFTYKILKYLWVFMVLLVHVLWAYLKFI